MDNVSNIHVLSVLRALSHIHQPYRAYHNLHTIICCSAMQVVAPKRAALAEANKKLEAANKKLAGIRARVKELQDKVSALEESFMKATEDKNAAIAQV